jgi:hypothetical protein
LNEYDLQAKRTLFIDDKRKILTLRFIRFTGMEFTGRQRVVDLFNKKHTIETALKLKTLYNTEFTPEEILIKKNSKFFGLPILFNGRRSKTHYDGLRKHPHAGHFCYASNRHCTISSINDDGEPSNSVECLFMDFPLTHSPASYVKLGVGD